MKKLKISLLCALALTAIFITAACNHGTQAGGGYAPVPYEFAPVPADVMERVKIRLQKSFCKDIIETLPDLRNEVSILNKGISFRFYHVGIG